MSRSISPYEKYGKASPAADASLNLYVFKSTDTISGLADRFFDDWTMWRLIAVRNSIADVRKIAPGTTLIIPQRPDEVGRWESA